MAFLTVLIAVGVINGYLSAYVGINSLIVTLGMLFVLRGGVYLYTGKTAIPEAYERLLLDVMLGDPTLFTRTDEVDSAWRFITSILDALYCRAVTPFSTMDACR